MKRRAICVASWTMLNTGRYLWNAKKAEDEKLAPFPRTEYAG